MSPRVRLTGDPIEVDWEVELRVKVEQLWRVIAARPDGLEAADEKVIDFVLTRRDIEPEAQVELLREWIHFVNDLPAEPEDSDYKQSLDTPALEDATAVEDAPMEEDSQLTNSDLASPALAKLRATATVDDPKAALLNTPDLLAATGPVSRGPVSRSPVSRGESIGCGVLVRRRWRCREERK